MVLALVLGPLAAGQVQRDVESERAVRARALALMPEAARQALGADEDEDEQPGEPEPTQTAPWRPLFDELDAAARAGVRRALPEGFDPDSVRPEILALWMEVAELPETGDLLDLLRMGFVSPHAAVRDGALARLAVELMARPDLRTLPGPVFIGDPADPIRGAIADARARLGLAGGAATGYVADEPVFEGHGGERLLPTIELMHGPLDAEAIEVLGGPLSGSPELSALALVARARDGAEVPLDEARALDFVLGGREEANDRAGSPAAERLVALLAREAPLPWLRGFQWELLVSAGAREDPWAARAAGALAFTYSDLEDGLELETPLALAFIEGFEAHRERDLRKGGAAAGLLVWAEDFDAPQLAGVARRMLIRRMVHGGETLIAVGLPFLLVDRDLRDPDNEAAIVDLFAALAEVAARDPDAEQEFEIGDNLAWILEGVTPELRGTLLRRIPRGAPIPSLRATFLDLARGGGAERESALELLGRFGGDPEVLALLGELFGDAAEAFAAACERAEPIGSGFERGGRLLALDGELMRTASALVAAGGHGARERVHGALLRCFAALRASGATDWSGQPRRSRLKFPNVAFQLMAPSPRAGEWFAAWMGDDLCARVQAEAAFAFLEHASSGGEAAAPDRGRAAGILLEGFESFAGDRRAKALAALVSVEPTDAVRELAGRTVGGGFGFGAVAPGAELFVAVSDAPAIDRLMRAALASPSEGSEAEIEAAAAIAEALRGNPGRVPFGELLGWYLLSAQAAQAEQGRPDAVEFLAGIRGNLLEALGKHPGAAEDDGALARALLAAPLSRSAERGGQRLAGVDVHGWRLSYDRALGALEAFDARVDGGARRALAAHPGACARLEGRFLLAAARVVRDVELGLALALVADIARRGERPSHDSVEFGVRLTVAVMDLLDRAGEPVDPDVRRAGARLLARLAGEALGSAEHGRLLGVAFPGLRIDSPEDAAVAVTRAAATHLHGSDPAQGAWIQALERCAPLPAR